MIAARTWPPRSTSTSTIRPIFSLAALRTSRPRMPSTSCLLRTVTDGRQRRGLSALRMAGRWPGRLDVFRAGDCDGEAERCRKRPRRRRHAATIVSFRRASSLRNCAAHGPGSSDADGTRQSTKPTRRRAGSMRRQSGTRSGRNRDRSGGSGRKNDRNPDIAADPGRIERNGVAMPAHAQIDARRSTAARSRSITSSRNAGRRGLRSRISPLNGSNSRPSEASSSVNGVALAQACGEQATG